jgi:hypothetical protein
VQSNGHAAYDQVGGPRIVQVACWSHSERYFFEAVQLKRRGPAAMPILIPARINELFAIDARPTGKH